MRLLRRSCAVVAAGTGAEMGADGCFELLPKDVALGGNCVGDRGEILVGLIMGLTGVVGAA